MGFGIRRIVTDATEKLAETARDTKSAITAVAVLGVAALLLAGLALIVALRGRKAATT